MKRIYLWLTSLCLSQLFLMLVFMNYTAVLPLTQREWDLSNSQAGIIFSAYQVGYILATLVLSNLADRMNTKYIFWGSALWSAAANLAFALFSQGFWSAVFLRVLAGAGIGGTYMPGLKLVAERFPSELRGRAVGIYVSSLVFGAGLSLMVTGGASAFWGWRWAIAITALGAFLGAVISYGVLRGVKAPKAQPAAGGWKKEVLGNRPALLMIGGYSAHMWEMYGVRGWMAAFLTACLVQTGYELSQGTALAANLAAVVVGIGGVGTGIGGVLSDRWGRTRAISFIMLVGSLGSFTFGWLFGLSFVLIYVIALVYGFFLVAESAVFSTGITELVAPGYRGAAMGFQALIGYGAAAAAPTVFGYILDLTNPGTRALGVSAVSSWGWAFGILGVGALLGPVFMWMLSRYPQAQKMAGGKG